MYGKWGSWNEFQGHKTASRMRMRSRAQSRGKSLELENRFGKERLLKKGANSQPGVEALGYVNSTMPDLLSSKRSFKVVLSPSFVSISPPNPSRSILSPTTGTGLFEGSAFLTGSFFGFAAGADAFALVVLVFFAGAGGGAGALRFLSSTTISLAQECSFVGEK